MPLFGSKKKLMCKFCGKNATYIKEHDEYFCTHCQKFQIEGEEDPEPKTLPILQLENMFSPPKDMHILFKVQQARKLGSVSGET